MLTAKGFSSVCWSCRLKILTSQACASGNGLATHLSRAARQPRFNTPIAGGRHLPQRRALSSTVRNRNESQNAVTNASEPIESSTELSIAHPVVNIEERVRRTRQIFGDALPRGHLSEEEYVVYERLYGTPLFVDNLEDLREAHQEGDDIVESEFPDGSSVLLRKGKDGELEEVEIYDDPAEDAETTVEEEADVVETMTGAEWENLREEKAQVYHQGIYEKSRSLQDEDWEDFEDVEEDDFIRAHPLTIAGRFAPSPSTVFLPKENFVDPVSVLLTRANHKHLTESANRIFGGSGLPHSAMTPAPRLGKEQKPIPLDPSQADMGNIEGDAYLAAVMPGTYATVMSTLVEVRRRLGTAWLERLLQKKGGPLILDAGSGGAAVIAWHEVLKAEWQRMHEVSEATSHRAPPLGKATVLTGSDVLRHRASKLLDNTTFIPRLPDSVPSEEEVNAPQPRKVYDLIIAPHTLWPLKQEYQRKEHVEKYWSLLNPDGGVLILLEKGLPRGFEVIAAARELLLDKHIASPNSQEIETPLEEQVSNLERETKFTQKEIGMIIAPCTNHKACPMYQTPGVSQGRKDFCFFSQRYIRPPYLQRILDAKDRNHEDVQFSYIAVQRGRDQRLPEHDILGKGVVQNDETTNLAFEGHEWNTETELRTTADVNPLSLPRLVLPALKRRGHIILDVCTPAGKLERWTVPRSFSKQTFRDARKARWGDLWALGAKTRIPKNVRLGRPRDELDRKGRKIKVPKKQVIEIGVGDHGFEGMRAKTGGRYQQDRKIRGSGGRKGRKQKPFNLLDE
ncbi:37S ribosomal protein Rsm22 [Zopfia rhizophila CBS 207.26]|uniref:37S ribosomal protein Rsm22 n=1 Tax=Zopfia rhizophila CBS 207.26 TaxID=1314779 RepID=A0A6A6ERK8_9PEZI|nr:37S ribosomal protein Rsm22 [Zopfia rhizophila CBS 207.26]